jgi:small subunit ribosomal protein S14
MLSSKIKDIKLRNAVSKKECAKIIYKFIFRQFLRNKELNSAQKASIFSFFLRRQKKIGRISKTQLVNRCVLTNRGRAVLRPYGISRVILRDMILFGLLPGFTKAVW